MRMGEHANNGSRLIHRTAVTVEITLVDGASLFAKVFPTTQGRISDLLNDERLFLPVECDGERLVLAKSAIKQMRMPSAKAPTSGKCPYAVLGLAEGASLEDVKRAYREACTANHPDRVRGAGLSEDFIAFATENMMRINSAYSQLTKGILQNAA